MHKMLHSFSNTKDTDNECAHHCKLCVDNYDVTANNLSNSLLFYKL